MRIATWNVNSVRARLAHVVTWLETARPDVLALQETKCIDELFPREACEALGYQVVVSGEKSYNGVAVLARQPLKVVSTTFPGFEDSQRRILCVEIGDITVLNIYIPNGMSVDSEKYQYKLAWLNALINYVKTLLGKTSQLLIVGDFNIAPSDQDVHDPVKWEGSVLCHDLVRDAFQSLLTLGLSDCFRLFPRQDNAYSWWDYRQGAFRQNNGLRIDHILASSVMAKNCTICEIDKEPRKWDTPSDHAPVIADFTVGRESA